MRTFPNFVVSNKNPSPTAHAVVCKTSTPQIVFAARPDGHVDYFNRRWYEYTGFPADGSTGDESWVAVHEPDQLERVSKRWLESVRSGEPYQCEYRLRRADGALRWHLGRALPVLSMGMSHDFEVAIEEGATEVRVGTALFGTRNATKVGQ